MKLRTHWKRAWRGGWWLAAAVATACTAAGVHTAVRFSHHLHTEQELECADCHSAVTQDADKPVAPLTMQDCGDCHDVEDEAGCATCHPNPDDPGTFPKAPERHLAFSHQAHEGVYESCTECHTKAAHATAITRDGDMIPGHAECSQCHQEDIEAGSCATCHQRLDLYQRRPEQIFSHENGYLEKHDVLAAGNEATCAQCHDQSYCADCHASTQTQRLSVRYPERVDRATIHPGDWLSKHGFMNKTEALTCAKCHGTSYCTACHERNGVGAFKSGESPHPPAVTWLSGGKGSHGAAAREDITACAACHDQGPSSNCVSCHRSGGVNPHPPGWRSPVADSERSAHPMCSICH